MLTQAIGPPFHSAMSPLAPVSVQAVQRHASATWTQTVKDSATASRWSLAERFALKTQTAQRVPPALTRNPSQELNATMVVLVSVSLLLAARPAFTLRRDPYWVLISTLS